jgi:hypothetical protein
MASVAAMDPGWLVDQYLDYLATMKRSHKDYQMLCIRDLATSGELTHVYRLLSKALHPDKGGLIKFVNMHFPDLDKETLDEARICLMDFWQNYQNTFQRLKELDEGMFTKDLHVCVNVLHLVSWACYTYDYVFHDFFYNGYAKLHVYILLFQTCIQ